MFLRKNHQINSTTCGLVRTGTWYICHRYVWIGWSLRERLARHALRLETGECVYGLPFEVSALRVHSRLLEAGCPCLTVQGDSRIESGNLGATPQVKGNSWGSFTKICATFYALKHCHRLLPNLSTSDQWLWCIGDF